MEVDLLTWFISVIPLQCECVCGSQQGRPDESRDQPALCCGMAAVAAAAKPVQRSIATLTSITILNASAVLFDWVVRSNSISFKRLVTVDVCLPGLARASQPASQQPRSILAVRSSSASPVSGQFRVIEHRYMLRAELANICHSSV